MSAAAGSDGSRVPWAQLSASGRVDQAARSEAIATIDHRGQKDKLGVDYIYHPAAVARPFDPAEQTLEFCAAWLHDVLEDTDITAGDLKLAGVLPEVIEVVELLTRREGSGDGDNYYRRIAENPAARAVKLADIAHNTEPSRVAQLSPETAERLRGKYEHARKQLGA